MEKSVLDITFKMINKKRGMTSTEVNNIDVTFVVKLCGLNIENGLYTQLPLNEDYNYFYETFNDINCKRTDRKLHYAGFKNSFSLILVFPLLVMDVLCLSILIFIIKS